MLLFLILSAEKDKKKKERKKALKVYLARNICCEVFYVCSIADLSASHSKTTDKSVATKEAAAFFC